MAAPEGACFQRLPAAEATAFLSEHAQGMRASQVKKSVEGRTLAVIVSLLTLLLVPGQKHNTESLPHRWHSLGAVLLPPGCSSTDHPVHPD